MVSLFVALKNFFVFFIFLFSNEVLLNSSSHKDFGIGDQRRLGFRVTVEGKYFLTETQIDVSRSAQILADLST